MLTPKEFAARLFGLIHELDGRAGRHITQTEFGEMVGVHQGTVSAWLRGAYLPDMPAMLAILDKTGARAGWMFDGEAPMFRPAVGAETTKPPQKTEVFPQGLVRARGSKGKPAAKKRRRAS